MLELLKLELQKLQYLELVAAQDYLALATLLNDHPLIPNPQPQLRVPKPVTLVDLWQQITPQEALDIYRVPGLKPDIDQAIATDNLASLQMLLQVAALVLSPLSVAKLQSVLIETILDPNYKFEIQGLSIAEELGIKVTAEDVQLALNL